MARPFKPSDLQLILLSTAAQHDGGHLLPLPESVAHQPDRLITAIADLTRHALLIETPTDAPALAWRHSDHQGYALIITDAGRAIIGDNASADISDIEEQPATAPAKPPTKITQVVELLRRDAGATLVELTDATGWLPHTTRAALTGLRKKGHAIMKDNRNKVTFYRIAEAA